MRVIHKEYPLANKQFAIENGPVEIVDLPIKNAGFPSFFVFWPEGNPPTEQNNCRVSHEEREIRFSFKSGHPAQFKNTLGHSARAPVVFMVGNGLGDWVIDPKRWVVEHPQFDYD